MPRRGDPAAVQPSGGRSFMRKLQSQGVHHVTFSVSRVTSLQAVTRLDERAIAHSCVKDRGFMASIYFRGPLGFLCELSSYRCEPPAAVTHVEVLTAAHKIRVERGDPN